MKPEYLERTTGLWQATGKLYHLQLWVERTLLCNLRSLARTLAVLMIGWQGNKLFVTIVIFLDIVVLDVCIKLHFVWKKISGSKNLVLIARNIVLMIDLSISVFEETEETETYLKSLTNFITYPCIKYTSLCLIIKHKH